jgi:hypothetical protein
VPEEAAVDQDQQQQNDDDVGDMESVAIAVHDINPPLKEIASYSNIPHASRR